MFDNRLAWCIAAALAAPAAAQSSSPPPVTASVKHADLDLAKPAGQAALKARIARAATAVCGPADYSDAAMAEAETCRIAAIAAATAKADVAVARAQTNTEVAANPAPPRS